MPRRARASLRRPQRLAAGCALALGLLGLAGAPESATAAGTLIRGRYRIGEGPFHRGGRLELRAPDAERVALRLTLPEQPLFARRQLLLHEGEALLSWAEPLGAAELLREGSDWWERLAALPAAAWVALLMADGPSLAACLEPIPGEAATAGAWRSGRLGGHPLRLWLDGARLRALRWSLPDGELRCSWQELPGGGGWLLRLRGSGPGWLRVSARPPRRVAFGEAEWSFLAAPGNRVREGGVPAAHP